MTPDAAESLRSGTRVQTPGGPGVVAYVRRLVVPGMPITAVSVRLDSQLSRADYTGTIYPVAEVTL